MKFEFERGALMYHSVTIGSMNTFDNWHLVPDGRPVISMPDLVTNYVDIPGMSGSLDLSESLTGYPLYKNREGELNFHVLNGPNYVSWNVLYQAIATYLHGRKLNVKLEDDPNWYYTGRLSLKEWVSNNDGTGSEVHIGYNLEPYKYYFKNSLEEAPSLYSGITVSGNTVTKKLGGNASLGIMPVVPEFVVSNVSGSGVTISLTNSELGITNLAKTITANGTRKFYDMVLSDLSGSNTCKLVFSGNGTVSVRFRKGSL